MYNKDVLASGARRALRHSSEWSTLSGRTDLGTSSESKQLIGAFVLMQG
jgi:hypothetical protein